jgi:hypothetical protein
MKDFLLTLLHLAVTTAKLCGPGGVRAVMAENLLLEQQLIVLRRARRRAPTFVDKHAVAPADVSHVRWISHCRELVQRPVAA